MKRVLVIDDSEEFRELLKDLLEDEGFEVEAVGDPDKGKSLCEASSFDLILCDLVMPVDPDEDFDEDGDSAMVGVHAISQFSKFYPDIPVVAISGHMDGYPLEAMRGFGATDTLSKPFGKEQLMRCIKGVLG